MILSAIVAVSDNHVIGKKGTIPWSIPSDQAKAKQITMGHPLIMGRKTHQSIGRTLPGRLNVVISSNPNYQVYEGSVLVGSLDEALNLPEIKSAEEAFIFGGESVYQEAMPLLQKIYLTRVHATVPGDSFFKYNASDWIEGLPEKHQKDEKNSHDYEFVTLERKAG